MTAARFTTEPDRKQILQSVTTPLSFFVLTLLIIEGALALVISFADFTQPYKWIGFLCMITIFISVVSYVAFWTVRDSSKLLYGKEELARLSLAQSAFHDQIDDAIIKKVRPDCLKGIEP